MLLIVDDSKDFGDVLARLLRYHGYEAQTARSGAAALQWLNVRTPSLILLDVMMPEMSGIDVLRHLRSDGKHGHTPVLILTAGCTPQEERDARELGAFAMLRKGTAEIGEIVSAIESALSKRQVGHPSC
jgi:CheY-like chemotaxis protein